MAAETSTSTSTSNSSEKKEEKRIESLGWLTESAVMPKKHKAIEGVGAGSILDLKAQFYRSQEEARNPDPQAHDPHRPRKKPADSNDPFSRQNPGVEAREKKDKLEMKAIKDGSVSYAALEKKAELYEKLARGELPDEEEKEKYCVDFLQKNFEHGEPQQPGRQTTNDFEAENENYDTGDTLLNSNIGGLGRTSATVDKDEHKRFVMEVHEEASEARQKAYTLKVRRQEQEAARREKLRKAYLKKQLEKMMSTNQASSTNNSLPTS